MKEKMKLYGAVFILVILIPYLLTVYFSGGFPNKRSTKESSDLEQKVIRLVSEEMQGSCEAEALKAQAVIARTNLYRNPKEQVSGNSENLKENMDKITFCVEDTAGEILTYKGEPIDAAYHAVSAKKTRDASEVPGQEGKDYLKSVDSRQDIESTDYLKVSYMEKQQMAEKLQPLLNEMPDTEKLPDSLSVKKRDSAGYVTEIEYEKTILNGEAVREALDLSSSCFYFSELEGKVRITTKGLGHGLGMSQYGAECMAEDGKDYREILQYYYSDVQIEKRDISE